MTTRTDLVTLGYRNNLDRRPGSGRLSDSVAFFGTAMDAMHRHVQHAAVDPEGGGLLIGRVSDCMTVVEVREATEPGPGDERERFGFVRRCDTHLAALDRAWDSSHGIDVCIGNWHTHPERLPTPSGTDVDEWLAHAHHAWKESSRADPHVFAIVGTVFTAFWLLRPPA